MLSLPFSVANGAPFPERSLLLAMTFGVVGTSLLLQGLTMAPLLRRLGLATEHEVDEYESLQGRLSAAEAAMHSLAGEHDRGELGEVQYERLRAAYIREQERLRRRLAELRAPADERDRQRERAATRRAALAERAAVQELYRRGAISEETLQSLDEEIEDRLASVEDAPGESA